MALSLKIQMEEYDAGSFSLQLALQKLWISGLPRTVLELSKSMVSRNVCMMSLSVVYCLYVMQHLLASMQQTNIHDIGTSCRSINSSCVCMYVM